jgi:hypothetical protein
MCKKSCKFCQFLISKFQINFDFEGPLKIPEPTAFVSPKTVPSFAKNELTQSFKRIVAKDTFQTILGLFDYHFFKLRASSIVYVYPTRKLANLFQNPRSKFV